MMKKALATLLLCAGTLFPAAGQQLIPQFKAGDRVALIGDSITHGGHYHSYIWLYYMTRFPDMPLILMNCGVGGDTAADMLLRLDYDVFSKEPTYITLTFGMNDTGYMDVYNKDNSAELADERVASSIDNYGKIVEELKTKAPDATVVMIGGSPYDETSTFNDAVLHDKNAAICRIVDAQKDTAAALGWGFVDFNAPMVELSKKLQETDPRYSFCPADRIHPDKDGQMVMAYEFLKAQGLAGKKVADIRINAKRKKAELSENCAISGIKAGAGELEFDYLAKSLPYPCDSISEHGWGNIHSQKDALKIIPFTEEFNREDLCVTGLKDGTWRLTIDGQPIADFTAAELAEGINMAEFTTTPQYRQASAVMYLNEERLEIDKRLREYVWIEFNSFKGTDQIFVDDWKSIDVVRERAKTDWFMASSAYWYCKSYYPEIRALWKKYADDIVNEIYRINKPVSHHITLRML